MLRGLWTALKPPFGARCLASGNDMGLIKLLRAQSGAPLVDVKAALVAADWKLDAAFDELRKRGLVAAAKKVLPSFCLQVACPKRRDAAATHQAGRTAAEGLVCVTVQGSEAALVEINSETDFVARSAPFQTLLRAVAASALLCPYPSEEGPRVIRGLSKEALQTRLLPGTAESVAGAVTALAAEVRENISLRRAFRVSLPPGSGLIGSYHHGGPSPGLGRIGGIVVLGCGAPATLRETQLAQQLAMHVVAARPTYLSSSNIDALALQQHLELVTQQSAGLEKPPAVKQKIVEGQRNKWFSEVCLLDQPFVVDDSMSVKKALENAGAHVDLLDFCRIETGEGIEREATDFASEVAAMANS